MIMKKILFLFAAIIFIFTGCTNPTRARHPSEDMHKTYGEIVKYEGIDLNIHPQTIAYEVPGASKSTLFKAEHFCYDPQNKNLVFPITHPTPGDILDRNHYLIVPKDLAKLCKNGAIKNNSFFSRNHALKGFIIGATSLGLLSLMGAYGIGGAIAVMGDGSGSSAPFIVATTVIGALLGGAGGAAIGTAANDKAVDDILETCEAYYNDEELQIFLESNSCY